MKRSKYRNKCWIPFKVIEDAVENNYINSIAVLVLLKGIHNNNTFYNFSSRKIAKQIRISHSNLSKHIKILEQKGLVRTVNKNLTIVSAKKTAELYSTFLVPVSKEKKHIKNLSTIKTVLKSVLIVRNIHKQQIVINQKSKVISCRKADLPISMKLYKKIMRKFDNAPEKNFEEQTIMSVDKFGSTINRSKETGKRFKKSLINLGLIESEKRIDLFSKEKFSRKQFFSMEAPKNYFITKSGYVYISKPCIISSRLNLPTK